MSGAPPSPLDDELPGRVAQVPMHDPLIHSLQVGPHGLHPEGESGPRWPGAQRSSPHNERRLHLRFGIPAESAFDSASGKLDSYITLKQFSNFQMSC